VQAFLTAASIFASMPRGTGGAPILPAGDDRSKRFRGTNVLTEAIVREIASISLVLAAAWGLALPGHAAPPQEAAATPSPAEERVLENDKLRVRLRSNLTFSVEDLGAQVTWGSDPWENAAGRIHLRGKRGEAISVSLNSAGHRKIETLAPAGRGDGVLISLSDFRSRMGPVRSDRDPGAQLSLALQILLAKDAPNLILRIQDLQNRSQYWDVESVEWPLRLFPVRTVTDDGYVVFPEQEGMLVPSRFEQGYFRYLNWIWERIAGQAAIFDQSSMPWYGAKLGRSSYLCIIETPDDVAYGVIANDVRAPEQPAAPASAVPAATTALFAPRISAIWPYWRTVKGELGYARVANYIFQPNGGYVEMCNTYRAYAEKTGKVVTLKQKIAANPKVERLIGAPNFEIQVVANRALAPQYQSLSGPVYDGYHRLQTSFDQITAIIHDLKDNLGVDRAVIRIAGWGRKGYDNDRPVDQATEVNLEAGGAEKLAAAIAAAKATGFLGGLWDNYRNFDLNAPSYDEKLIMRDAAGALINGFSSEAGFSQEICPLESLKLFQRNMTSYERILKPDLIYLDTIGGLPLIECYNPLHPLTRTGVREQRLNIMRVATGAGVVLGAEGPPQDWNLSVAHFYDEGGVRFGVEVPLWALVYHDCAMLYRQHASPYNYGLDNYGYSRGPWPAKFLRSILYGDQSSWTISNAAYWAWRKTFTRINDVLAPHQRRLAFDRLADHRFLTPDFLVQRSNFSSGVEVTVNYGEFPFKFEDGSELPAYGYRVKDQSPEGRSFAGSVEVEVAPSATPKAAQRLRNEKVSVTDVVLRPGESETVSPKRPGVTVYFQSGSLEVMPVGGRAAKVAVQRGETRRETAAPRIVRNTGSSELHYARVDFLGSGSTETWGAGGLAPHYKMIYEDRLARVYDIRIPAHTNEPQHTHHDRVVICLSGAKLSHLYPDGREEPSTLATGEVAWRRGATHIGQNLGDTDLWVIAIEPK
jgi:hypothetical protein